MSQLKDGENPRCVNLNAMDLCSSLRPQDRLHDRKSNQRGW